MTPPPHSPWNGWRVAVTVVVFVDLKIVERRKKKKGSITFPNWVIEEGKKDVEAAGIVSFLFSSSLHLVMM